MSLKIVAVTCGNVVDSVVVGTDVVAVSEAVVVLKVVEADVLISVSMVVNAVVSTVVLTVVSNVGTAVVSNVEP